jgi:hypothetical protein
MAEQPPTADRWKELFSYFAPGSQSSEIFQLEKKFESLFGASDRSVIEKEQEQEHFRIYDKKTIAKPSSEKSLQTKQ